MNNLPKTVVVTNIPSPYRVYLFDSIAHQYGDFLTVIYCAKIESNRDWKVPDINHTHFFLKETKVKVRKNAVYFNKEIFGVLNKLNPEVLVTAGFNPTMIFAWLWTVLKRKKHIVYTDSWLKTVNELTILHRIVRKIIFTFSHAFICIGKKGAAYLKSYEVKDEQIFVSPLVIDKANFQKHYSSEKTYDVIFSGQLIERKMPMFFCDVVSLINKKYKPIKILIIGNGTMKEKLLNKIHSENIDFKYAGFIQQEELPKYYSSSKILLFPSFSDPWGIVANEACAAGLPVLTCENTGAADELIVNNYNGFVVPLDANIWADAAIKLLDNPSLYLEFSSNSLRQNEIFSISKSMMEFIDAINYAYQGRTQ